MVQEKDGGADYWSQIKENNSVNSHLTHILQNWKPQLKQHIDGLPQDCSNSNALAMELLQSCAKPSTWS